MRLIAITIIAITMLLLAGCKEPTIKWNGRDATASQIEADIRQQQQNVKEEAAKAEAMMNAELVGLKNRTETDLADIRAKYEPVLASAKDKAMLIEASAKQAREDLARVAASRGEWLDKALALGNTFAPMIPGGSLVWGGISAALAILLGKKTIDAKRANANLTSVVDAIDHANGATPKGEHDAAWDKAFSEWLVPNSKAAIAVEAISARKA